MRAFFPISLLAAAVTIAAPALAVQGTVSGKNHCYRFAAPAGWVMDPAAGKEQSIPMVFYPEDGTWADAPTVIYTRNAEFVAGAEDDHQKIQGQVERALTQHRTAGESPDSQAKFVRELEATDGTKGELWQFTGDRYNNTELVAYFVGRATLNYFVMSSREPGDFERSIPVLVSLAESYHEGDDCKPCPGKAAACIDKPPAAAKPPAPAKAQAPAKPPDPAKPPNPAQH